MVYSANRIICDPVLVNARGVHLRTEPARRKSWGRSLATPRSIRWCAETSRFRSIVLRSLRRGVLTFLLVSCISSKMFALDPARLIDQYGHDAWTSQQGLASQA